MSTRTWTTKQTHKSFDMKNKIKIVGRVVHRVNGRVVRVQQNAINNGLLNNLAANMSTPTDRAINDLFNVANAGILGNEPETEFNITTPTSGGDGSNPATGSIAVTIGQSVTENVRVHITNGFPGQSLVVNITPLDSSGVIANKIRDAINDSTGDGGLEQFWVATANLNVVEIEAKNNGATWNGYDIAVLLVSEQLGKDGITFFDNTTSKWLTMETITQTPVNSFARKWRGTAQMDQARSITDVALGHSFQSGSPPYQTAYATQNFTALELGSGVNYQVDWEIFLQTT